MAIIINYLNMLFKVVVITLLSISSVYTSTGSSANVKCDKLNTGEKLNAADCVAVSDSNYACCYLYADIEKEPKKPEVFQNEMCLPLSVQATPYPEIINLAGLGFKVTCPKPKVSTNTKSEFFVRGTHCGPAVTYGHGDCNVYSYDDNTCCLGTFTLEYTGTKVDSCLFYGAKFDPKAYGTNYQVPSIGKMEIFCEGSYLRGILIGLVTMIIYMLFF